MASTRRWLASKLAPLAVPLLGGCGGKVVVDGGGAEPPDTPCWHACEKVEGICAELDVAACNDKCEVLEQDQTECGDTYRELTRCILEATDPVDCDSGNVPTSCQDLFHALDGC